jgi:hypothetical protein
MSEYNVIRISHESDQPERAAGKSGQAHKHLAEGGLMHWQKELAYTITPKSGPMRRMESLLDANRALVQDLPRGLIKTPHWHRVGNLLVHAAESGRAADILEATENLLDEIDRQGWMTRQQQSEN